MAVDEGSDHTMSVWDWSRGERGTKVTETKCSTETVVAAEFHPLEPGVIVSIGKLRCGRNTSIFPYRVFPFIFIFSLQAKAMSISGSWTAQP